MTDNISVLSEVESVKQFLPDQIDTVMDVSAVLGAFRYGETAEKLQVPIDTVMYSTPELQQREVGELDIVIINLSREGDTLMFDGVENRPLINKDVLNHMYYRNDQGSAKTITQRSSDDDFDDLLDRSNRNSRFSSVHCLFFEWVDLVTDKTSYAPEWVNLLNDIEEDSEIYKNIKQELAEELYDDKEGSFSGFMSITIDGKPPYKLDNYMDILKEIVFTDNVEYSGKYKSVGEAPDLITGEHKEVLGASSVMWADYNSSKIREEQPKLDVEENWRNRPIGFESGLLIKEGGELLNQLHSYMGFGDNSSYEINYYAIPFPSDYNNLDELYSWYTDLTENILKHSGKTELVKKSFDRIDDDEYNEELITGFEDEEKDWMNDTEPEADIDKILISLQKQGTNKDKELSFNIISRNNPKEIKYIINSIADDLYTDYPFIRPENSKYVDILSGVSESYYLGSTVFYPHWFARNVCGNEHSIPSSTSVEFQLAKSFLYRDKVNYSVILQSFLEKLKTLYYHIDKIQDYSGDNTYGDFIDTISRQELLLRSLNELDLLQSKTFNKYTINKDNMNNDITLYSETETAKIPYLLGRIVGNLSYTQQTEYNISEPAFKQYSIDYVSLRNFEEVYQQLTDKIFIYTNKNKSNYLEENGDMRTLANLLKEQTDPTNWELSEQEFKYYYALGLTDGFTYTEQEE